MNGDTLPTSEAIINIAKFFNVSSDYLLGLTDISIPLETEEQREFKTACEYTGLSENAIKSLNNSRKTVLSAFIDMCLNELNYFEASSVNRVFVDLTERQVNIIDCENSIKNIKDEADAVVKEQIKKKENGESCEAVDYTQYNSRIDELLDVIRKEEQMQNGQKFGLNNRFNELVEKFIDENGIERKGFTDIFDVLFS
jgi:hypothetical protein